MLLQISSASLTFTVRPLSLFWIGTKTNQKCHFWGKQFQGDSRTLETSQISVNKFGILCSCCLWRKHGFVCHCQIYQNWFWEKELDCPLKYFAESESNGKLLKHKSGSGSENPKSWQWQTKPCFLHKHQLHKIPNLLTDICDVSRVLESSWNFFLRSGTFD